jgi:hypothetical protein
VIGGVAVLAIISATLCLILTRRSKEKKYASEGSWVVATFYNNFKKKLFI